MLGHINSITLDSRTFEFGPWTDPLEVRLEIKCSCRYRCHSYHNQRLNDQLVY